MTRSLEQLLAVEGGPVRLVEHWVGEPQSALDRLADKAHWLTLERAAASESTLEWIEPIGPSPHGRIVLRGPMQGRLLEALVVLLVELRSGRPDWDSPAAPALLRELDGERRVTVAATPSCPYCPAVVAAALRLAQASPRVHVTIARADREQLSAVRATPALLVDDQLVATGPIAELRLVELVLRGANAQ